MHDRPTLPATLVPFQIANNAKKNQRRLCCGERIDGLDRPVPVRYKAVLGGGADDQSGLWTLVHGPDTQEYARFFGIRLADPGRNILLSLDGEGRLCCIDRGKDNEGRHDRLDWRDDPNNLWEILEHRDQSDDGNSGFRLVNVATGMPLFGGTHAEPGLLQSRDFYQDQVWQFPGTGGSVNQGDWPTRRGQWHDFLELNRQKWHGWVVTPENMAGFDGWKMSFRHDGAPVRETHGLIRQAIKDRREIRHLMVFVHGVGTDFGPYRDYVACCSSLFDEFILNRASGESPRRNQVAVLGIDWPSQDMAAMLKQLLEPGAPMPAKALAEGRLKDALNDISQGSAMQLHLVGHSMGAQVLLYLLPQLQADVAVGSMMFLQGFAPSSAFRSQQESDAVAATLPYPKKEDFQAAVRRTVEGMLDLNAYYGKVGKLNFDLGPVDFNPERTLRQRIGGVIDALSDNMFKVTGFGDAAQRVTGPILATTTPTFWGDYQVGAAALSCYAMTGVLGVHGFANDGHIEVPVHQVQEDVLDGGGKSYGFADLLGKGGKFFNLKAGNYITDHDDFKNRAIAFAHLRALGWIGDAQLRQPRAVPRAPQVRADRWMAESWDSIRARDLAGLCLPGAHDAGTAIVTAIRLPPEQETIRLVQEKAERMISDATGEGKVLGRLLSAGPARLLVPTALSMLEAMVPRLTQTQTMVIREQLMQGCRYFDLRPALHDDGGFYLAHGEDMSGLIRGSGFVGTMGEKLESTLEDIARFAEAPDHASELIVLKFSHAADWRTPGAAALGDAAKADLLGLIRGKLQSVMIDHVGPDTRIDRLPLEALLSGKRRVLCLFDNDLKYGGQPGAGGGVYFYSEIRYDRHVQAAAFSLRDPGNFALFDDYANSRNSARVIDDQREKFLWAGPILKKVPAVFTLSWTITLPPGPALGDLRAVLDHARAHNAQLRRTIESWIQRGELDAGNRPNIIYVDAYDRTVLDTVMTINALT